MAAAMMCAREAGEQAPANFQALSSAGMRFFPRSVNHATLTIHFDPVLVATAPPPIVCPRILSACVTRERAGERLRPIQLDSVLPRMAKACRSTHQPVEVQEKHPA